MVIMYDIARPVKPCKKLFKVCRPCDRILIHTNLAVCENLHLDQALLPEVYGCQL